jgi:hypothetical protein
MIVLYCMLDFKENVLVNIRMFHNVPFLNTLSFLNLDRFLKTCPRDSEMKIMHNWSIKLYVYVYVYVYNVCVCV